ncbi:hypothetical protein PR048_018708 [Dryococelus australis]|uniref:Uncharacterized protein n=1 Tax=Dryococelus australis TaxID=614101 RepID=A0ABQ9HDA3_9NEOP|nr:hypothetical protein PR048_018708 [Dryococelus australis]
MSEWAALNIEIMTTNEGEVRCVWSRLKIKDGGNGRSPIKPADQWHRLTGFPLARRPGIEPGSLWSEEQQKRKETMWSGEIWAALNIEVLRADKCKGRWVWNSSGMQERRKRKIPKKNSQPVASSGKIPTGDPAGDRTRFTLVRGERPSHCVIAAPGRKAGSRVIDVAFPFSSPRSTFDALTHLPPGRTELDSRLGHSLLSHVVIVADDAAVQRVFSGGSNFPLHCIQGLLHIYLASPTSALKTPYIERHCTASGGFITVYNVDSCPKNVNHEKMQAPEVRGSEHLAYKQSD